ncbi:transposon Ty3-I Gag-Pol polyprotein [Elysia marginata]|uniref:Transposon Ty3-I Gag-Pol polyprotein n=1 Tax=Elysia marginata TaxID=1093978 RepID=A0AAV4JM11_9GAST|nr:transposon Ty3-I Gag-Pol polyprotein [Elysia marginata]
MKYQGPYVTEGVAQNNNFICTVGNKKRTYHANIFKKYEERQPSPSLHPAVENACAGFVKEEEEDTEADVMLLEPKRSEYPGNVAINNELTPQQNAEVRELMNEFADTLSDVPGKTTRVTHKIELTDVTPFEVKQHLLLVHAIEAVNKEIDFILESGIISRSTSPYASPITLVMKKDGAIRLCLNFRNLTKIPIF